MEIVGIVLGLVAIGLFIWLRKEQQMDNGLHAAELEHTHQGMNALMNDFNNYQVETDRKIVELEAKTPFVALPRRSTSYQRVYKSPKPEVKKGNNRKPREPYKLKKGYN